MTIIKEKLYTFCKREEETIEHIIYDSNLVLLFWFDFESYFKDECMNDPSKMKAILRYIVM